MFNGPNEGSSKKRLRSTISVIRVVIIIDSGIRKVRKLTMELSCVQIELIT